MKGKYTKDDLVIALLLALFFSLLHFMVCVVLSFEKNVNWSDTVYVLCLWSVLPLRLILILNWYMCVERYFVMEYSATQRKGVKAWLPIGISIGIMVILGIVVFKMATELVHLVGFYWYDMDKVWDCIIIEIALLAVWSGLFVYCIRKRRTIGGQRGLALGKVVLCILILGVLVFATLSCRMYTEGRYEGIWWEVLLEMYKEGRGFNREW